MRVTWTAGSILAIGFLLLLTVGGVFLFWNRDRILAAAKSLFSESLNPASRENVVNKGVSAVVSGVTGREETLGGWLAEIFDPATKAVRESLKQKDDTIKRETLVAPSLEELYEEGRLLN